MTHSVIPRTMSRESQVSRIAQTLKAQGEYQEVN